MQERHGMPVKDKTELCIDGHLPAGYSLAGFARKPLHPADIRWFGQIVFWYAARIVYKSI